MSSSNARLTLSAHREGQFSEIALKNSDLQTRVEQQQEALTADSTKSYISMQFYRRTHIVPFKRELKPYISMAPAPRTYTTTSDSFEIDYSETFIGPIAAKLKISTGQINPNQASQGAYFAWSLPNGFTCALINQVTMSTHNEEIMKFSGKALYAISMLDIDVRRMPALKALWKEAHVEWQYAPGVPTDFLADGVTEVSSAFGSYDASNATYFKKYSSFEARTSYIPLQAPRFYRPEFYVYVPLDILPMNRSLYYAFPHIAVHDLKVQIKIECKTVMEFVNVYASDARLGYANDILDDGVTLATTPTFVGDSKVVTTATGYTINGDYVDPNEITWIAQPALLSKELYVTFYAVQAYLENALSVYRYTQIFPDVTESNFTVTGQTKETIAYSGNYSHIALMPNYSHYNIRTYKDVSGNPTAVKASAATITLGDTYDASSDDATVATPIISGGKLAYCVFPVDPFHEFLDVAPIDTFTLSPRSSEASVNYTWSELAQLQPYLLSLGDANCTPPNKNNMAIISFNALLDREKIINFYPLGIAPNLELNIASTIFTTTKPGVVQVILMKFSEVIIWLNSCVKRFN